VGRNGNHHERERNDIMKKWTLALAICGGLAIAGSNTLSAADWRGGSRSFETTRYVAPARHAEPVRRNVAPVNNNWNDGCFPQPVRRYEPAYGHGVSHGYGDWNRRADYRHYPAAAPHRGFNLDSLGLNFWFGR